MLYCSFDYYMLQFVIRIFLHFSWNACWLNCHIDFRFISSILVLSSLTLRVLDAMFYYYVHLPAGSIRLLIIYCGQRNSLMQCSLIHSALGDLQQTKMVSFLGAPVKRWSLSLIYILVYGGTRV